MPRTIAGILTLIALVLLPTGANAFMKDGCGSGNCVDCHALTADEAMKLLKPMEIDKIAEVRESPVKGLWAVDAEKGGVRGTVFIDFGKKHVLQAQIIRIDTKENVTSIRKVDPSKIALDNALLMGKADAAQQIIVFSDVDCHFCANLHGSIKAIVAKEPGIAFRIILFSRNNDPNTILKERAVLCANSPEMLEQGYLGKPLPPPACTTDAATWNGKIAAELGINGTPVLILPDGRLIPGFRDPDAILRLLKEGAAPAAPGH